eukprot:Trichotokara_eunicae@DN801_c0_g1_i2.p1
MITEEVPCSKPEGREFCCDLRALRFSMGILGNISEIDIAGTCTSTLLGAICGLLENEEVFRSNVIMTSRVMYSFSGPDDVEEPLSDHQVSTLRKGDEAMKVFVERLYRLRAGRTVNPLEMTVKKITANVKKCRGMVLPSLLPWM